MPGPARHTRANQFEICSPGIKSFEYRLRAFDKIPRRLIDNTTKSILIYILQPTTKVNMASGFFAILDDIGALMDDVAVTAKVATRKTAAILSDDLAVNAEKATGFLSSRELPVLWSITKGSFVNKLIIVPIALLLNVFFPIAIKIILVLGGFYLAYEGVEKIIEYFFHRSKATHQVIAESGQKDKDVEKAKVKSAIMTDFILSIEIVIIALGTVLEKSLAIQIITVSAVAALATIGVYGIVAIIVRMDDAGYKLIKRSYNKGFFSALGLLLVKSLPVIIKVLSIAGTIALILVSGGIFVHNIEYLHHIFPTLLPVIKEFAIGLTAGLIVAGAVTGGKKILALLKR
jgi:predicted DNA repair protein MutK